MVLGRSPIVVCALVALLALVVGVVGAVSASPDGGKERNKAHTTLKVLAKDREARVVDLGPRGPSHGDMRVVNGPLYNASGTEKVGRLNLFCVLTDPADEPGETAQTTQCSYTFTLPGGEISAQGVTLRPELSGSSTDDFVALSGGTGRHVGVQGEVRFRTRGEKVSIAFRFVR